MPIEHVFVLMLENRSFDHMLGFSNITGADATTGQITSIEGVTGIESNCYNGTEYKVTRGADNRMPKDPHHEFADIVHQLCGQNAIYSHGGPYPPINSSGFAASYMSSGGQDPAEIMECYSPEQLPVLNALAREFVVCDRWHCSLPGPTWPNRMFVHAASSGGLDHSPSVAEIAEWEGISGFPFPKGTIFDRLNAAGIRRRLYGNDDFPMVSALKGIHIDDIRHFSLFAGDLRNPVYADRYVFIEPSYDVFNNYRNGNSQHPLADVTHGESLIKQTYEAIRNSPAWDTSLLIITWDEHGGFFDHVIPPVAPPPADGAPARYNQNGFAFDRYGVRVPALVISPLIPKNLIDHRLYDHASIPATVESVFGLAPLTARDAAANRLDALCTLAAARGNAPEILPNPAVSAEPAQSFEAPLAVAAVGGVAAPNASVNEGNLPAVVYAAMQQDLATSPPEERQAIVNQVANVQTREDAHQYVLQVRQKVQPLLVRAAAR